MAATDEENLRETETHRYYMKESGVEVKTTISIAFDEQVNSPLRFLERKQSRVSLYLPRCSYCFVKGKCYRCGDSDLAGFMVRKQCHNPGKEVGRLCAQHKNKEPPQEGENYGILKKCALCTCGHDEQMQVLLTRPKYKIE